MFTCSWCSQCLGIDRKSHCCGSVTRHHPGLLGVGAWLDTLRGSKIREKHGFGRLTLWLRGPCQSLPINPIPQGYRAKPSLEELSWHVYQPQPPLPHQLVFVYRNISANTQSVIWDHFSQDNTKLCSFEPLVTTSSSVDA